MSSIAIVGKSGTGKSSSINEIPQLGIKGLTPNETVIINVAGKDLPFRGWKNLYKGDIQQGGNYIETSDSALITKVINFVSSNRPDIKNIIIDDAQYVMAFEFMRRAKETGYNKFSDIGVGISNVISAARTCRKDLKVFFLWHPEQDKETGFRMKTVGKMVDDYLTLEGLFTAIFYTKVSKGADNKITYQFVTNNDGEFPAKTPIGMFDSLYIPNDLGIIAETIDKFNEG